LGWAPFARQTSRGSERNGMHGAEGLFIDRAGSLQERARPGEAPLREKQTCQVAERRRGVGVLGAERCFIDVFEERLCRRVAP
jgi:hypothetical protein